MSGLLNSSRAGYQYPDDFNMERIRTFCRSVRADRDASDLITDEQILEIVHLGHRRHGQFVPNNSFALIFALDPQRVLPGSYIHFLRYNGTEEGSGQEYNVIKDRIISGTVLEIVTGAASVIDANLREFTRRTNGKFFSVPEYPRDHGMSC